MDALVRLDGVGYRYGRDVALEGVDLALAAGERLAILGPNGGGKSTLLRLVLGLAAPTAGRVHRVAPPPRIGYVPQFPSFERGFPLRVREMILQGRLRERRLGGSRASDREVVDDLVGRLDLGGLADAYLSELSGGELKRALIARALAAVPELLALDEPAASLDERSRRRLWELVGALPAATTVLLVTHDLAPATFAPTRAILVDRRVEPLPTDGLHAHPLLCGHGLG
jgi:zinc transport system ATP-binding protein